MIIAIIKNVVIIQKVLIHRKNYNIDEFCLIINKFSKEIIFFR